MKISSFGAVSLLLVSRIFTLMIYTSDNSFTSVSFLLGICLSTLIQGIFSSLVIFLSYKSQTDDFIALINRNRITRFIFPFFYTAFFILSGATLLKDFTDFANRLFFEKTPFLFIAVPLVSVAVYGAFSGIKSLSRSASVIFCIFSVMFVITLFLSSGKIIPSAFDEKELSFSSVILSCIYDISVSPEFVMMPFFCLYSRKIRKDYFSFLTLRLLILETSVFLMTSVLGKLIDYSSFPFFTLVGAVGGFIKHDALYLVIWTFSAVLKLSLMIYFSNIFTEKIPLEKSVIFVISGVLTTIISLSGITPGNNTLSYFISAVFILFTGGIIPVVFFSKEVFSLDKKIYYDNNNTPSSDRL